MNPSATTETFLPLTHAKTHDTNPERDGNGKCRLDDDTECLVVDDAASVGLDGVAHRAVRDEVDDERREDALDDRQHKHEPGEERAAHADCVQLWVVD